MGTDGSVSFMFDHIGQFLFAPGTAEDKLMEAALEAGADDVMTNEDGSIEVVCPPNDFPKVKTALETAGFKAELAELTIETSDGSGVHGRRRGEDAKAARRPRKSGRRAGSLYKRGNRRRVSPARAANAPPAGSGLATSTRMAIRCGL